MAITYNGTPVTSVLMDGVTYTTIADENGNLYYACNPVCYYGNALACYSFNGFSYCCDRDTCKYYARANVSLSGYTDNNAYLCWVGGPRSCNSNMFYDTCMEFQLGCIHQRIVGCGFCNVNYTFDITQNPQLLRLQKNEGGTFVETCPHIGPTDTCTSLNDYKYSGALLISPWVEISYCEFYYGLSCQSLTNICRPTVYLYCAHINARLKNETGYDNFSCHYVINPLGSRTTGITSSIQIC